MTEEKKTSRTKKRKPKAPKTPKTSVKQTGSDRILGLGFSPCPNDTYMFHALVTGKVEVEDVSFAPELLDIQELNQRALGIDKSDPSKPRPRKALGQQPRPLVVTKLSIPALALLTEDYAALSAGAAVGRGCGPLVVRNVLRGDIAVLEDLDGLQVAVPGEHTTAALLLRIFGPRNIKLLAMPFQEIMPAVADRQVDAGVVIHESRFTYRDDGLILVQDLGKIWEEATSLPLPLAVIAVRRDLGSDLIERIEDGMRRSVEHALTHDDGWDYVLAHAQELSEEVCRRHVELYVNDYSRDLGKIGRKAIEEMIKRGRAAGRLPRRASPWR